MMNSTVLLIWPLQVDSILVQQAALIDAPQLRLVHHYDGGKLPVELYLSNRGLGDLHVSV
jgi:hypothetical protein